MISIVIICRNEAAYIKECLDSIAVAAGEIECEILIVDGGSRDDTLAQCHAWALTSAVTFRVVGSSPGYGRQRNAGVRAACFDWIAFVSADVRVPSEWLHEIARMVHEDVDLMIGGFDLVPDCGRGAWMAPLARTIYPPVIGSTVERCSSVNLVARRDVLRGHPFDEDIAACEDKDFAARVFATRRPRGVVRLSARPRHLARETLAQWLRKLFREAQALAMLARRHKAFPDCFGWRAHARRALLLGILAIAITAAGSMPLASVVAVAAIFSASVHPAGWPRGTRSPLLHALSMLSITAGVLAGFTGSLARRAGERSVVQETL